MMQKRKSVTITKMIVVLLISIQSLDSATAQTYSIARQWNEIVLEAIRNDFARPTVHARNLFHTCLAMYDIWALSNPEANTYLLGKVHGQYVNSFDTNFVYDYDEAYIQEAISYANYRLIKHRFKHSPDYEHTLQLAANLFIHYGFDTTFVDTNYHSGQPAALGNYVAHSIIQYGLQDGSNEENDYENIYYQVYNEPMNPSLPGVHRLRFPNRWQPLSLDVFIDQSGNVIPGATPDFLSPDWGRVQTFSLTSDDLTMHERDRDTFWVYHDPGIPPQIDLEGAQQTEEYQWNFAMVSVWGAHLDPADSVLLDISPGAIGDMTLDKAMDYRFYYNYLEGGDISSGHERNPFTELPYEKNLVPRGDYARVLAEFWADGPDSETPPGHWFTILNRVNDHPSLERKFKGSTEMDNLEWDIKSYFALGGAMHDAAIAAWSIKGWYDYIRPISAIRSMADRGQSSDTLLENYHLAGIPLIHDFIEVVDSLDSIAGSQFEHVGKIKLYTWRGPEYIMNDSVDVAGVGWILAENWWPYQRPTFVTPPFAGYISGHSTFSRAAAEVLTAFTGSPFFPGGLGEFICKKNEFLVFEDGPSQDIVLQWATYRDASDQTSLSRIWGGIHPPTDDIPGRLIGESIGLKAFELAEQYFGRALSTHNNVTIDLDMEWQFYPNPAVDGLIHLSTPNTKNKQLLRVYNSSGKLKKIIRIEPHQVETTIQFDRLKPGLYILELISNKQVSSRKLIIP